MTTGLPGFPTDTPHSFCRRSTVRGSTGVPGRSLLSLGDELGGRRHKWGSGPSAAFIKEDESPWVFGAVVNNIWSFGGPPGSSDRTNLLLLNPVISYHFGDGWSVGSSPNITTNWIASGGKWTLPVGGGFGKLVRLGEQPIKLDLDAYYNAIRPKAGNETWLLQVTLTLSFSGQRSKVTRCSPNFRHFLPKVNRPPI